MEQGRYRSRHLIPMFIRTTFMKYLSMILLLKIFVYLPPAPVAGGLELLRTPLINQRRCQVVYILFRLTPAVQCSTVLYSTVQYSISAVQVQYSTEKYNTVQWNAEHYSTKHYITVHCTTKFYSYSRFTEVM